MWHWFKWVLLIIIVSGAIFGVYNYWVTRNIAQGKEAIFITASPVDLSQMRSFSKVRSCAGHDYSGENIKGETETNRSMKHYAIPANEFRSQKDTVKIIAPFNGKIAKIEKATKAESTGSSIYLVTVPSNGWWFEFGHVEPLPDLKAGQKVAVGDLLGYFQPEDGEALDLQFYHSGRHVDWNKGIDSYMNHATAELLAEYAKHGLTPENMVITKEYRDQHPCRGFNQDPVADQVEVKN